MAQRSARARYKLEKISQSSGLPLTPQAATTAVGAAPGVNPATPFSAYHNISKSTSFSPSTGLLTPSASSIATGSSEGSSTKYNHPGGGGAGGGRHGFPFYNKNGAAVRKSALRAILEGHSDKIRGRLEDAWRNNKKNQSANSNNTSGGYTPGGSQKLGVMRESKPLPVKSWDVGGKAGIVGWDRLQMDPELWLDDGDTLVYLSPQGHPSHQYSRPSFRIQSSALRETESQYFIALLSNNKDATPPRTHPPPRPAHLNLSNTNMNRPPPTPPSPGSPMSMTFDNMETLDRISSHRSNAGSAMSRTVSNTPSVNFNCEGIKHEIFFPAPVGLSKEQTQKYHLTTRNVFAILFGKSLVGVTLGEALLDLVERMDAYIPPTTQSKLQHRSSANTLDGTRKRKNRALDTDGIRGSVGRVVEYLLNREFDDFRNCPEAAAGVLVFAEKYQLGELWREAFCHCVGMLSQLEGGREYMEISAITKALIDRASLEIQVRTGGAESRLATFQYDDMWPTSSITFSPSKVAFGRFQKFLMKHYQSRFGSWPPSPQKDSNHGGGWGFGLGVGGGAGGVLSRQIYAQLQRDFTALYDYLVDKDVVWQYPLTGTSTPESSLGPGFSTSTVNSFAGTNSRNRPKMISLSKKHFRADDLQIADILIGFDMNNCFPHIPHPFPLVPELRGGTFLRQGTGAASGPQTMQQKHSFLAKLNTGSNPSTLSPAAAAMDKAAALALSESTNIHSLLSSNASNELVDAFARHEKERSNGEFTPSEGRKGRWVLIYGVLQTLATVTWDAPGLKYTEGVDYFLNTKLKGTPPWVSGLPSDDVPGGIDDFHSRSHCWTVMRSWDDISHFQSQLTPVASNVSGHSAKSAPPRTGGDTYGTNSRSIGVGVGDTTDTDVGYNTHNRIIGARKRKAIIPKSSETAGAMMAPQSPDPRRSGSMSGDEGDDEADEEDDDVVMGEEREVPILERDLVEVDVPRYRDKGKEKDTETF